MIVLESFRNIFAVPDLRKRVLFTFGLLAMSICLPSMPSWQSSFAGTATQVQLTFSGFVLAYGLTVVDMVKAVDNHAVITDIRVEAKSGGRSGDWVRVS